ncbi:terminase small subunit [Mycobacterium phage BirdsNest]|uniref:Adenylate kinase n=1 Tax=Mycobacterium phage BirdsNest TaxID=2686231 RepID=A0A6B9LJ35_9CAUD|nr:terminase small subunit [Mycobacterium phage BirdsNest]QHB37309.1 adenylate kinase [Mycobacterium phage BirdsNest]
MTDRLIYLIGAPGSGKSTLMARLTSHLEREPQTGGPVAHDLLRFLDGVVAGAEIGRRRELFGGTDALPASIIEKAIPWVQSRPYELLLAEGARLANQRFLMAAREAGYEVHLAHLDHPDVEEWRAKRSEEIGKVQDASWVKGRTTASAKLAEHFVRHPELGVRVYNGHPDRLIEELESQLG